MVSDATQKLTQKVKGVFRRNRMNFISLSSIPLFFILGFRISPLVSWRIKSTLRK